MTAKILKLCISENRKLINKKLSIQNFGNVSIRIDNKFFAIKPSGTNLAKISYKDIPIISIKTGQKKDGKLTPSTDTITHSIIYKNFPDVKSISHTHSKFAVAWAQASKSIPVLGTTHADFCESKIPCLNYLEKKKIINNYEFNTGIQIVDYFKKNKLNIFHYPGILLSGHGSFAWGKNLTTSTSNIEIIEFIAETAYYSKLVKINKAIPKYLVKKHFDRKNGVTAYYGQKK